MRTAQESSGGAGARAGRGDRRFEPRSRHRLGPRAAYGPAAGAPPREKAALACPSQGSAHKGWMWATCHGRGKERAQRPRGAQAMFKA